MGVERIKPPGLMAKLEAAQRIETHLTRQLEILAEENKTLQEMMSEKDQMSKLRGWAVDRAIAVFQINKSSDRAPDFEQIRELAEKLAVYSWGDDYVIPATKRTELTDAE